MDIDLATEEIQWIKSTQTILLSKCIPQDINVLNLICIDAKTGNEYGKD